MADKKKPKQPAATLLQFTPKHRTLTLPDASMSDEEFLCLMVEGLTQFLRDEITEYETNIQIHRQNIAQLVPAQVPILDDGIAGLTERWRKLEAFCDLADGVRKMIEENQPGRPERITALLEAYRQSSGSGKDRGDE